MSTVPLAASLTRSTSPSPLLLLRLEAALVAAGAIAAYASLGYAWWLFGALILAPDAFMLGYVRGARVGARVYNFGHTYFTPAVLAVLGYVLHQPALMAIAAIWTAHIGLDRLMGYGLKYQDDFKHTHL